MKRTNEIGAVIPLLETLPDVAGRTITADALLTQRRLADYLLGRGADYLFTVKGNQPKLHDPTDQVHGVVGRHRDQQVGRDAPVVLVPDRAQAEFGFQALEGCLDVGYTVCGHGVRASSIVLVVPWLLHRHRRYWTRADTFEPERFLGQSESKKFIFIPFGVGPRGCIGASSALMEAMVAVATVTLRYRLRLASVEWVEPVGLVTLRLIFDSLVADLMNSG